eukprot:5530170-Pyramimonas_sp.AAC.1
MWDDYERGPGYSLSSPYTTWVKRITISYDLDCGCADRCAACLRRPVKRGWLTRALVPTCVLTVLN